MKFQQPLFLENGGQLLLPPNPDMLNANMPDLTALDVVQQYPLTTKFRLNGKTYVYARGVVQDSDGPGTYSNAQLMAHRAVSNASVVAIDWLTTILHTHAIGDERVSINFHNIVKDELKYGQIFIGVSQYQTRGILGNSVSSSVSPYTFTLDLDFPLAEDTLLATTGMYIQRSQYAAVEFEGVDPHFTAKVGVPVINVAQASLNGQWFWIQTWGPCQIAGVTGVAGSQAGEREVVFTSQGTIDIIGSTELRQRAGYIIDKTKNANEDAYEGSPVTATDSNFVMLQLDY